MPTYEYECPNCGDVAEVVHGMKEEPKIVCSACNGGADGGFVMTKLMSGGAGVIFKGDGFYETDYKQKDRKKKNNR